MNWRRVPIRALYRRSEERGRDDLPLLSVYREYGVVPREGRVDNHNRASEDLSAYKHVRPGDLVLNKMKTWQGSLGVSDYEGIVSPAYFVARRKGEVSDRFMHHLLRSLPLIAEYGARSKGIRPSQWDLPWEQFAAVKVLVPPLVEQHAIAGFLDAETERIDALIAKKERMVDLLLERRAAAVSRALWRGQPGRIRLKHLTTLPTSGNRDHSSFTLDPTGVPCLRGLNIRPGRIVTENLLRISAEDHHRLAQTSLNPGDLVIVRSGNAGSAVAVPNDFGPSNCVDVVVVRRADSLLPRYLEYVVNSREAQEEVRSWMAGALLSHFNAVDAANLGIPWRSLVEQEKLLQTLDRLVDAMDGARDRLGIQIDLLREHRQALITAAVTGELDIPGVAA